MAPKKVPGRGRWGRLVRGKDDLRILWRDRFIDRRLVGCDQGFSIVLPRRDAGNFAQERRGCSHSGRQVGSEELRGRDGSTRQAAVASQGMANKGSEDSWN